MSLYSTPNTPLIFRSQAEMDAQCICPDFKQLVDRNDTLSFQLKSIPCSGPIGSAYASANIWTTGSGNVCSVSAGAGSYERGFPVTTEFSLYKFIITVNSITAGELLFNVAGDPVQQSIQEPGTYELFFSATSISTLVMSVTGPNFIGCFQPGFLVYGISLDFSFAIVNESTLLPVANFIQNPVISYPEKDTINVSFSVADQSLPDGCYRIALSDSCQPLCGQFGICNQEFIGINCWQNGSDFGTNKWETESNGLAWAHSNTNLSLTWINQTELCVGQYSITYRLSIAPGDEFRMTAGDSGPIRYADGTYTEIHTITTLSLLLNNVLMTAIFRGLSGGEIFIDLLTVTPIGTFATAFTKFTDPLRLGDYSDKCKYLKIEGCNGEAQFGIPPFSTGFRFAGRKGNYQYPTETEINRTASGRFSASYVDRLKKWKFRFGRLPEYLTDFLSLVIYFDRCYINGVEYFPADDEFVSLPWNDADNTMPEEVSFDMIETHNKVRKTICAGSQSSCMPTAESAIPYLTYQNDVVILTQGSTPLYQE